MKKPVNKFAVGLWLLAILYLVGEAWGWYYFNHAASQISKLSGVPRLPVFLDAPVSLAMNAAILASLGMLIEIGDKIRWLLERRPE
jgi:hypothetical protein